MARLRCALLLSVVAVILGAVGAPAPRPAAAKPLPKADLAIVSVTGPASATIGSEVTFTIIATNLGPATSELDVAVTLSAGLTMTQMTCDRGVSPDTPSCEYSNVAPGTQLTTTVVAMVEPGAGPTESVTACKANAEGLTVDRKAKNNCKSFTVTISGE